MPTPTAARPRYRLLALDLDGTLFGPDGRVSAANAAAVARAREAGVTVVICTGRGLAESKGAIGAIDAHRPSRGMSVAPIICAGGAMLCDAASGRTLHRWPMRRELVGRLCEHFRSLGRAPLLLKDRDAAGFDYLVLNYGPIEAPNQWWFEHMPVIVRFADGLEHDEHPEHTVRIGFAADSATMRSLSAGVMERFGRETLVQHYAAVAGTKGSGPHGGKDESIHLMEAFDPQVNKWTALHRLALELGVARDEIAAIGDEINDLQMIEGAALGVAMGNAVDRIKTVARRQTRSNGEDGVAYAIEQMLTGAW
ncbi:MAG: HAD hydrolase family protein [Phycisphaerales bacterium]|nr:HAD hydrolase family protein [Phycisphaerales bacterium]